MPTYTPNTPLSNQQPAESQPQMNENFQSIDDGTNGFANNHISLTDATLTQRGKHKFMQMPEQGSAPGTAQDEGALYCALAADLSQPDSSEVFWRREFNGGQIRLSGVTDIQPTQGRTYLANQLQMQWGTETLVASGAEITFLAPFGATPYQIQCTGLGNLSGLFIQVATRSASSFFVSIKDRGGNNVSGSFTWLAIGPILP